MDYRWMPLAMNMHHWKFWSMEICPCCGTCMETVEHLHQCKETGMKEICTMANENWEHCMYTIGIPPQLISLLVKTLDTTSTILNVVIFHAFQLQHCIGQNRPHGAFWHQHGDDY